MINDEDFLEQFEAGVFPHAQWHHKEHIKVAYLYLTRYPFETAMDRMRDMIKAHNMTQSLPDTLTSGYHETMTQAWMRLVYLTLCEYGPAETAADFYEQNPQLSQKKVTRLFYSREVMMTAQAKSQFVEPDLAPLPKSRRVWNIA